MIAELFYPKELKGIIVDLRAKDDLNEEALKRLDGYIMSTLKKFIIVTIFFSLILFHPKSGIETVILILFSLVFMVFILFLDMRGNVKKFFIPYNYNKFTKGFVESCGSHRGAYGMTYNFLLDGVNNRSFMNRVSAGLVRETFQKGDSVLICYDPENFDYNVPFIPSLAKLFYLRKGRPNGHY